MKIAQSFSFSIKEPILFKFKKGKKWFELAVNDCLSFNKFSILEELSSYEDKSIMLDNANGFFRRSVGVRDIGLKRYLFMIMFLENAMLQLKKNSFNLCIKKFSKIIYFRIAN